MPNRCTNEGCPGDHYYWEKLSDCVAVALWDIQMNGGMDESTGNTDWHYAVDLFRYPEATEYVMDDRTVTFQPGIYLLFHYTSGSVNWAYYPDAATGEAEFGRMQAEWDSADWD